MNISMKVLLKMHVVLCIFIYGSYLYGQCSGCTVTNPTISGTYTFTSGSVVCFTSNATLNDVVFQDNSKLCVAPGVTVVIQNNVNTTAGSHVTFEVGGTLQLNQTSNINSNLDINVASTGVLKSGSSGTSDFALNGNVVGITNYGLISVGVLSFNNASSNNLIDNHGIMNIASNVNIKGSTVFVNDNQLNIIGNYSNTTGSKYINCGIMNSSGGFNLGGGIVVNTGTFKTTGGSVDFAANSTFYNYGVLDSKSSINSSSSALIYNEGLFKINSFQGDGKIEGPATGTNKKGYVEIIGSNRLSFNNIVIGPNLDFTYTQGTTMNGDGRPASTKPGSGENGTNVPTNRQWIFQLMNGTYQEVNTISFDCRTQGNCSAPLVTNINVCATTRGVIPPVAVDDSFTIYAGDSSSQSVLVNDTMVGGPATNLNVTLTQQSTSNSGVTLNTSTGLVQVAPGTPAGVYTLVYSICDISDAANCDNATVTVTVNEKVCYKPGITTGTALDSKEGITSLGRADQNNSSWPAVRKGAWLVLESKTKGFVINRLSDTEISNIPTANLVEGMMVYNISKDCLQINVDGTASGWKCFNTQACPD